MNQVGEDVTIQVHSIMNSTKDYHTITKISDDGTEYEPFHREVSNLTKLSYYDNREFDSTGEYILMLNGTDWIVCHATSLTSENQPLYANQNNNSTVTSGADAIANPSGLTYAKLHELNII